jgi:hypothetical protein
MSRIISWFLALLLLSPTPTTHSKVSPLKDNMDLFEGKTIELSSINCNSLNMSHSARWNQSIKVYGIAKLKSDIIFLSDTRLSNKNLVSAADEVSKMFLNNPYGQFKAFLNSSRNKRGVGILIEQSL